MIHKAIEVIKGTDYAFAIDFGVEISTWDNIQVVVFGSNNGAIAGKFTKVAETGFDTTITEENTTTVKVLVPAEITEVMEVDSYDIEVKFVVNSKVNKFPVRKVFQIIESRYEN